MKELVGLTAEECKKAIQVFAKLMCSASSVHAIADRPCAEKKRSLTTLSPSTRKRRLSNPDDRPRMLVGQCNGLVGLLVNRTFID